MFVLLCFLDWLAREWNPDVFVTAALESGSPPVYLSVTWFFSLGDRPVYVEFSLVFVNKLWTEPSVLMQSNTFVCYLSEI